MSSGGSPDADKGKQAYMTVCIACHGPDPKIDGPIGPAIAGASKELLEARSELEFRVEQRTSELRQELVERQKAEEKLRNAEKMQAFFLGSKELPGLPRSPAARRGKTLASDCGTYH